MSFPATTLSADELQQAARDHLWLHFTRMSAYMDGEIPVIVRGRGVTSRTRTASATSMRSPGSSPSTSATAWEEMGEAAAAQMRELPFYTNWSYAHPRAIELAGGGRRTGARRPERVFFSPGLGGSRVGLEARSSVPRGAASALEGRCAADRLPRDDDGRARLTASRRSRRRSSRSFPTPSTSGTRTATTGRRTRPRRSSRSSSRIWRRRSSRRAGHGRHGHHGAGSERRRLLPPRPRVLAGRPRDLRPLWILLAADEVITGFGRLGAWFGSSATTSAPTSSPARKACPRRTRRSGR